MERRNFLRTMLGVAGATALPSEMWPFRKIFLPASPKILSPALRPFVVYASAARIDFMDLYCWGTTYHRVSIEKIDLKKGEIIFAP